MMGISKSQVITALIWKYMESGGRQTISFIVSIFLARLLMPEDFGAIAIISVFISLSNVLIQTGFSTALIQKKDADEVDFSSVFFASIILAVLLYLLLFYFAPKIACFYNNDELSSVLRVLSLVLPFGAYNSIQTAEISRRLDFKLLFNSTIIAIIISGIIGIVMAYLDFGLWALVGQSLSSVIINCIVMHFIVKWRPSLVFSWRKLKELLSFGWKITASSVVDSLYNNMFNLIIGKKYSSYDLGYYTRGRQFPLLLAQNINTSISTVMLPTYSRLQEDKENLKIVMRRSIMSGAFVMFPLMIGLATCAKPFIGLIYTDKWLNSVPYMQIFCFAFMFYPVNMANTQVLNGIGRSDIFLKLNISKKFVGILLLLLTFKQGVLAIAIGYMVSSWIGMFFNIIPNRKLINYGIKEQLKDILPSLILSLLMGGVCYSLLLLRLNYFYTLLLQVLIGAIVYLGASQIFQLEAYVFLVNTIKDVLKNRGAVTNV